REIAAALERLPRILDEVLDLFAGLVLRQDAHDLDALDRLALVRGVVALAAADALHFFWRQRGHAVRRATGQLLEIADRAHAEARRTRDGHLRAHRRTRTIGTEQVEPQQHVLAARAVDLAILERLPDRLARAAFAVHGDEPARVEVRLLALGF